MLPEIDFGVGSIVYNEFHIEFDKQLKRQKDSLTEDLLQVEYPDNYLIDMGWYPEYNYRGNFVLNVIHDYNWENLVYEKTMYTKQELINTLLEAIQLIECLMGEI